MKSRKPKQKSQPKTPRDRRVEYLDEVGKCILGGRTNTHGDPEDNFEDIAAMLNVRFKRKLKEPLTALDVSSIGVLIKEARKISKAGELNPDNYIDGGGYNGCGYGILKKILQDLSDTLQDIARYKKAGKK